MIFWDGVNYIDKPADKQTGKNHVPVYRDDEFYGESMWVDEKHTLAISIYGTYDDFISGEFTKLKNEKMKNQNLINFGYRYIWLPAKYYDEILQSYNLQDYEYINFD